jgi:hypothetical protein
MHLHSEILKVDIVVQLGLALATSSDEHRVELRKHCDEVAIRNSVD